MPEVLIPAARGSMRAYFAVPAGDEPKPGVVVLHDVGGMTRDHRHQADWLAEAGFLALAVDLYYKGGILLCLRSVMRDLTNRSGPAFDDVEACRTWLARQPNCTGKTGVIGFCMGGGFALLLVSGHGFSAASVNYGGPLPKDFDDFLQTACPVVGSYGGQAKWEQGVAEQLREKLDRALVANDCLEYPDAGHGFMNNHQHFFFRLLRWTVIRGPSFGYHERSCMDARRRIAAFFHLHLI